MSDYTAFLIIAGIVVPIYDFGGKVVFRIGRSTRSAAGSLQSDVRGEKKLWTGKTVLTRANFDLLKAATQNDVLVPVTGAALPGGGPITCIVRLDDFPYELDDAAQYGYQLNPTITLEQS